MLIYVNEWVKIGNEIGDITLWNVLAQLGIIGWVKGCAVVVLVGQNEEDFQCLKCHMQASEEKEPYAAAWPLSWIDKVQVQIKFLSM